MATILAVACSNGFEEWEVYNAVVGTEVDDWEVGEEYDRLVADQEQEAGCWYQADPESYRGWFIDHHALRVQARDNVAHRLESDAETHLEDIAQIVAKTRGRKVAQRAGQFQNKKVAAAFILSFAPPEATDRTLDAEDIAYGLDHRDAYLQAAELTWHRLQSVARRDHRSRSARILTERLFSAQRPREARSRRATPRAGAPPGDPDREPPPQPPRRTRPSSRRYGSATVVRDGGRSWRLAPIDRA